jgi:tetratricopeptide (TPR) repeat protein
MVVMAIGQGNVLPQTGKAARLYEQRNYQEAKTLIDNCIAAEGKEDAYTWHVRGHIYKEIYKNIEGADKKQSPEREIAIQCFLKCLELDNENKFLEWNKTSLRFLSSTYWNDAVTIMENQRKEELPLAEELFMKYLETMEASGNTNELNQRKLDFYKAFATANRKEVEKMRLAHVEASEYAELLKRVIESHKKALMINPSDYGSNYNYAINLYNEAAYRIENIPLEADLTRLILDQQGCIAIFEEALPIAQKAEELKPGRIEILKALRAIYLGLNNYDEFDRYNDMIREKQGELIIQKKSEKALNRDIFNGRLDVD